MSMALRLIGVAHSELPQLNRTAGLVAGTFIARNRRDETLNQSNVNSATDVSSFTNSRLPDTAGADHVGLSDTLY